jgi:hypothetical protein
MPSILSRRWLIPAGADAALSSMTKYDRAWERSTAHLLRHLLRYNRHRGGAQSDMLRQHLAWLAGQLVRVAALAGGWGQIGRGARSA